MLPLRVRVDYGAMALKGYSRFPIAWKLEPRDQTVLCYIQETRLEAYSFADMLMAYSTALAPLAGDNCLCYVAIIETI